jgi:hypothetical protein
MLQQLRELLDQCGVRLREAKKEQNTLGNSFCKPQAVVVLERRSNINSISNKPISITQYNSLHLPVRIFFFVTLLICPAMVLTKLSTAGTHM